MLDSTLQEGYVGTHAFDNHELCSVTRGQIAPCLTRCLSRDQIEYHTASEAEFLFRKSAQKTPADFSLSLNGQLDDRPHLGHRTQCRHQPIKAAYRAPKFTGDRVRDG
jgi:hypothetical protein